MTSHTDEFDRFITENAEKAKDELNKSLAESRQYNVTYKRERGLFGRAGGFGGSTTLNRKVKKGDYLPEMDAYVVSCRKQKQQEVDRIMIYEKLVDMYCESLRCES